MFLFEQAERWLWRRGFLHAPLRRAMRNLFFFSWALFLLGMVLLGVTRNVFWAGMMALLSCWNFYTLARFIQCVMPVSIPVQDKDGVQTARVVKKGLLLRTYFRLFITGLLVYISLVTFHAEPVALAAGLSVSIVIVPISLMFRY